MFNPELLFYVSLVTIIASFLQASVGYGFGLVAVPLLVIIDVRLVPVPIILASLVTMLQVTLQNRLALSDQNIRPLLIGLLVGSPLGAYLLSVVDPEVFVYLIMIVVSIGLVISVFGLSIRITPASQFIAGITSNIFGATTGMGGAPLALLYQHESGPNIRAILSTAFFLGGVFGSIALGIAGLITTESLWLALHLIPGLIAGGLTGRHFARFIDRGYSRLAIITITTLSVIYLAVNF